MENNQAFIATLKNIQKIEGADKIVSADVTLNGIKVTQVVVSVETQENTPVIYFDSNLCINPQVIEAVDKLSPLYGKEKFSSMGNYLGKGGRVRVIKLRGVISNGLTIEVSNFPFFRSPPQEGFSFTDIDSVHICHKYLPPSPTQVPREKKGKTIKKEVEILPEQFHFHIDTSQLLRNVHNLHPGQIVSISRKVHGTSAIFGRSLIKRRLSFFEKVAKKLGVKVQEATYGDVIASRTVIKEYSTEEMKKENTNPGFYKTDVWKDAGNKYFKGKLHDGETVYYEIVGYLPGSQSMIQKGYDYGCSPGEYKIAVYRITFTNTKGIVFEYSWQAMKERCKELDVSMVQEFFYGKIEDLCSPFVNLEEFHELLVTTLKKEYLEKDCWDCAKKVPDEGIVLRVEGKGIEVYKLKSEKFFLSESQAAEKGEVSIEDTQNSEEVTP